MFNAFTFKFNYRLQHKIEQFSPLFIVSHTHFSGDFDLKFRSEATVIDFYSGGTLAPVCATVSYCTHLCSHLAILVEF